MHHALLHGVSGSRRAHDVALLHLHPGLGWEGTLHHLERVSLSYRACANVRLSKSGNPATRPGVSLERLTRPATGRRVVLCRPLCTQVPRRESKRLLVVLESCVKDTGVANAEAGLNSAGCEDGRGALRVQMSRSARGALLPTVGRRRCWGCFCEALRLRDRAIESARD